MGERIEGVAGFPPVGNAVAVGIRQGQFCLEIEPQLLPALGEAGGQLGRLAGVQQLGWIAIQRGGLNEVRSGQTARHQRSGQPVGGRCGLLGNADAVGELAADPDPPQRDVKFEHVAGSEGIDQFDMERPTEELVAATGPGLDNFTMNHHRRLGDGGGRGGQARGHRQQQEKEQREQGEFAEIHGRRKVRVGDG